MPKTNQPPAQTAGSFDTSFFAGNRQRLRQSVAQDAPDALIVMTANGLLQRNGDSTYKYRQDSSFWYLTGINEPDILLVIDGADEYLILPGRDAVREAFDGAVTADMLTDWSGIKTIHDEARGWQLLKSRLGGNRQVATSDAVPAYVERHGLYTNPARARLMSRLRDEAGWQGELVDLREKLARMRVIKQPVELRAVEQAIDVTVAGIEAVAAALRGRQYDYEYQVEADLTREFRRRGYGHAFEPIVAAGQRACQLHYLANNGRLKEGSLMVLDTGAEASMYAADISRTVAIGQPSDRQRAVFEAVCAVQDFALSLIKPGMVMADYEKDVNAAMAEKLRQLGLLQSADSEAVRKYYPHATSHFLGLDVHDVGDYRQPLEAGMVLTCEPGIYIPEEGIGVRIEDDVLVTADGHEALSRHLPRDLLPV